MSEFRPENILPAMVWGRLSPPEMVRSRAGHSSVLRCEEVIPDFDENGK
ncbi:hypothetical protein PN499_00350 [Kamptonema animale CS-326]|nr:hypothetical protein [Kamptonema animale]MDB9509655.1 hypothetical protein [Kamptonema animale CS-326]